MHYHQQPPPSSLNADDARTKTGSPSWSPHVVSLAKSARELAAITYFNISPLALLRMNDDDDGGHKSQTVLPSNQPTNHRGGGGGGDTSRQIVSAWDGESTK